MVVIFLIIYMMVYLGCAIILYNKVEDLYFGDYNVVNLKYWAIAYFYIIFALIPIINIIYFVYLIYTFYICKYRDNK